MQDLSDGAKRKTETDPNKILVAAPPSGKKMSWILFVCNACPMAFDPVSKCKLAICPSCTEDVADEAGNNHQEKRGRTRRGGTKDKTAAKTTVTANKGICPNHIWADLKGLPQETNKQYLRQNRKKKEERTNENIATHCLLCGIEL